MRSSIMDHPMTRVILDLQRAEAGISFYRFGLLKEGEIHPGMSIPNPPLSEFVKHRDEGIEKLNEYFYYLEDKVSIL